MKERPILFSAPMVCAILEGRKTQTRRVVKPQPNRGSELTRMQDGYADGFIRAVFAQDDEPNAYGIKCPFGQHGDRLWVRETWCVGSLFDDFAPRDLSPPTENSRLALDYAADAKRIWGPEDQGRWRPSIHMPRWASRITLEITSVRVERLQDISDFDAYQEGAPSKAGTITGPYCMSYKEGFRALWESIYGPGSWGANPWVWVLEFKRVEGEK